MCPVTSRIPVGDATFIQTARLSLAGLQPDDISDDYLAWLNDADVLRFRARKAFPTRSEQMREYVDSVATRGDLVLTIRLRESRQHIGNIALSSIDWVHGTAELSIMIGAKDVWGRGLGREAIHSVSRHAFMNMGLRRLWAESPNPAFNAAVRALGWTHEGAKRQAFLVDGTFVDIDCWGLLRTEFKERVE